MAFVAVYDANVLYPASLRDLLIRLGQTGLFQAKWTDEILDSAEHCRKPQGAAFALGCSMCRANGDCSPTKTRDAKAPRTVGLVASGFLPLFVPVIVTTNPGSRLLSPRRR